MEIHGSIPKNSQASRTLGWTGMRSASSSTPTVRATDDAVGDLPDPNVTAS